VTLNVGALKKQDVSDKRLRAYLKGDILENELKKSKGVMAIIIEIENPGDEFELSVSYTGTRSNGALMDFLTEKVEANSSTSITIETSALKWDFGAISEMRFYLDYADVSVAHTFTIKSITLTY
jgi:hypothetical protein